MEFQRPELEVIRFKSEEVIVASNYCDGVPMGMGDLYGSSCNFDPDSLEDEE